MFTRLLYKTFANFSALANAGVAHRTPNIPPAHRVFQKTLYTAYLCGVLAVLISPVMVKAHEGMSIQGFVSPESVVQDANDRIFVSEIGEFGKDGDGKISVIEHGNHVRVFTQGLDDPKGLALLGKELLVADKDKILRIDSDGKSRVWIAKADFPNPPAFLNDVEVDGMGNVYVSDSGDLKGSGGSIYKITPDGKVSLVISGKEDARILAPNGLLMADSHHILWVLDFVSGDLYQLDMRSKKLSKWADGFGGADGVIYGKNAHELYVSDWKNGRLFHVKLDANGAHVTDLKLPFQASADIALTRDKQFILVPDMKSGSLVFVPAH